MKRMALDPTLFTVEGLLGELLTGGECGGWRLEAEILPDYVPPKAPEGTRPRCVVRWGTWFLRWSVGPIQGYFWDTYGEHFEKPEWALIALINAPRPPGCRR